MPDDGQRRAVRLRVVVTDGRGRPAAVRGLAPWLARVSPIRRPAEVSIALVPDSQVRALNRRFRGVDRVTDVLSFPSDVDGQLGDIVIARGVARRQARAAGHSPGTELRLLALHGILHLLGFDHERDGGQMARAERRLRHKGGLPAGLIERRGRG